MTHYNVSRSHIYTAIETPPSQLRAERNRVEAELAEWRRRAEVAEAQAAERERTIQVQPRHCACSKQHPHQHRLHNLYNR